MGRMRTDVIGEPWARCPMRVSGALPAWPGNSRAAPARRRFWSPDHIADPETGAAVHGH